jgi:hypothetical protein
MSTSFADHLATLPAVDQIAGIELTGSDGVQGVIENKPGSQGSLRVYLHLLAQFGAIDVAAASEGLRLYAEHTQDARLNPGKHPNIDRLLLVESGMAGFSARLLLSAA